MVKLKTAKEIRNLNDEELYIYLNKIIVIAEKDILVHITTLGYMEQFPKKVQVFIKEKITNN